MQFTILTETIMYLVLTSPPPQKKKKFTLVLFLTSWDNCDTQEKLATMVMPIFFWGGGGGVGVNKVHYGLCEDGESKN